MNLLHFVVNGLHGPMTLTFQPQGKDPLAGAEVTDELARSLTLDQVQSWYTYRGHPARGMLQTSYRGRPCGLFKMVS